MYQIDINNPVHIHFIGIGGISMSGLAALLNSKGFTVSGSDREESEVTKALVSEGIRVSYPQRADNITDDIDLVVYTAAISPDNEEYAECIRRGLPIMDRAALLGQLCKFFNEAIGVAGTHGKTTTTSMLAMILLAANTDPTISVGGILPAIGGNLRIGNGSSFLFEACEYTNSFLKFFPTHEIILNIDADHLDFFKDIDDIRHSFNLYAGLIPAYGQLVINGEIPDMESITKGVACNIITYGIEPADNNYDYTARDISFNDAGYATYSLYYRGEKLTDISLNVPGIHNVSNSLAAVALSRSLGIELEAIKSGILSFTGTNRRFQKKGELNGVTIIDDYAHHPTEIKATLSTAGKIAKGKVICVFQPHTFSRTLALREDFVEALSHADEVVMAAIYPAREIDTGIISSEDIKNDLLKKGVTASYFTTFDEIEKFLLKNIKAGDLLITMGAGDIVKLGENMLKR
ncbi:MAG: UDP-N-acetylmuramate--L-alanine ligase [Clostridiales bacterium]|nr:UDP-N-acetylmuramate--L-alanine ligase [Clostridiales bacterium]